MKNIEIEVRGALTKNEYNDLLSFMGKNAKNKEADNRITTFFMIPDKTLKVAHKLDQRKCKIALKLGDIVSSSHQTEYEIDIKPEQFNLTVELFKHLGFTETQETRQDRINFTLNGYEFAVKWSKDLGYHFEAETVVDENADINAERAKLEHFVTSDLGLKILSEQEFAEICSRVDSEYAAISYKGG